jgi:hypothetical protein
VIADARAVLVHCYAPQDVAVRRYRDHVERGERHPVHFDAEQPFAAGGIPDETWDRLAKPLDLGIPTLTLDTARNYVTDLEPILAFVRCETEGN